MVANKVILVAGARGTGKTGLLKKLIKSSPLPKKLVVDTFDSAPWATMETHDDPEGINTLVPIMDPERLPQWKSGLYRTFSSDTNRMFELIDSSVVNALVVFEDATKYIGSRLSDEMRRFVYDSKQKNLNLVFVFHSLASIPPELVRCADFITLFKTNEGKPSDKKYPFPDLPLVMDHLRQSSNRYENVTIRLN